jgi:hypothetical protein
MSGKTFNKSMVKMIRKAVASENATLAGFILVGR